MRLSESQKAAISRERARRKFEEDQRYDEYFKKTNPNHGREMEDLSDVLMELSSFLLKPKVLRFLFSIFKIALVSTPFMFISYKTWEAAHVQPGMYVEKSPYILVTVVLYFVMVYFHNFIHSMKESNVRNILMGMEVLIMTGFQTIASFKLMIAGVDKAKYNQQFDHFDVYFNHQFAPFVIYIVAGSLSLFIGWLTWKCWMSIMAKRKDSQEG